MSQNPSDYKKLPSKRGRPAPKEGHAIFFTPDGTAKVYVPAAEVDAAAKAGYTPYQAKSKGKAAKPAAAAPVARRGRKPRAVAAPAETSGYEKGVEAARLKSLATSAPLNDLKGFITLLLGVYNSRKAIEIDALRKQLAILEDDLPSFAAAEAPVAPVRRAPAPAPAPEADKLEITKEAITFWLRDKGARRGKEIAQALGAGQSKDIAKQLKELVAAGTLRQAGEKAGTTYELA